MNVSATGSVGRFAAPTPVRPPAASKPSAPPVAAVDADGDNDGTKETGNKVDVKM